MRIGFPKDRFNKIKPLNTLALNNKIIKNDILKNRERTEQIEVKFSSPSILVLILIHFSINLLMFVYNL